MGSAEWERATTPDDFAGADAMVEALDDGGFRTVIGGSPVGIPIGGSPFGHPFWRITLQASALRLAWRFMPDYRRFRMPGGTYFFTVNLLERRRDTLVRHVDALREAVRVTRQERPFHIDAWVVLPDHMHCVWTLPPGDDDFSNRWKAIKIRFVQALPRTERRSNPRKAEPA
ncbi:MAG: transposase [Chromatiales bacterium]